MKILCQTLTCSGSVSSICLKCDRTLCKRHAQICAEAGHAVRSLAAWKKNQKSEKT